MRCWTASRWLLSEVRQTKTGECQPPRHSCSINPMICTSNFALFAVSCLVLLLRSESAPKSIPLKDDANIAEVIPFYNRKVSPKNYFNSTPHARKEVPIISYNSPDPDCNVGFKLAWSSSVASPVYATPVIFPAGNETVMNMRQS